MANVVLVVDDDASVRDAFELTLTDLGYEVLVAASGADALAMVAKTRPDLIYLDLKMPGMDGVEVLRKLWQMDKTLKIYIVTAFASEYMDRLKEAVAEGCHFELAAKPLSAEQIAMITKMVMAK